MIYRKYLHKKLNKKLDCLEFPQPIRVNILNSKSEFNQKGALRIPLVAQNSSVLLLPKVAASLKLHDSTTR